MDLPPLRTLAALAGAAFVLGGAETASAQTLPTAATNDLGVNTRALGNAGGAPADPNALRTPASQSRPPPGHRLSARQAIALARRVPKVRAVASRHPRSYPVAYLKGATRWQVSLFDPPRRPGGQAREIAQVLVDDPSARVKEAWTGFQVAWTMARGYSGAFGHKVNAPWVWLPLCALFLLPFVDPRRPWRLRHLDLLVLLGFSVSLFFFNRAEIGISVPLVYPLLGYLLVRMLGVGFARRRGRRPEPLRLLVPVSWLSAAVVFVLGFHVGLNVTNSNVIDVGYAGVIGADRLQHGQPLYGHFPRDNEHGDTYGPVAYEAYVPAELALPWSGSWDDLPAAHAAALAFDLLTALGLWLLGRRIRGPTLGVVLSYGWATFPFTLFVSNSNSNDALVSLLVVAALLVVTSPPARGAATALAGLTKFAPLALAPMLATYDGGARAGEAGRVSLAPRRLALFALAFAAAAALALLPVFLHDDLGTAWDRTLGFQSDRGSPFSVWGFYGGLGGLQAAVKVAGLALAVLVAFLPARRDVVRLAALGAAVIIALQLGVSHWFYLYLAWFLPLVLIALFGSVPIEGRRPRPPPGVDLERSRVPAPAWR